MRRGLRRIFYIAVAALGAAMLPGAGFGGAAAADSDEVYTVGNYPVDAQAANAVAAKEKALAAGQQAAFRSLLKRIVPVLSYDRLNRLAGLKSGDFFEGVAVRSESNSRTRYIASLDFAFRPQSVRTVLEQEGLPFVDEQAREIMLVPVFRDGQGNAENGAGEKAWTSTWKGLDLDHSVTPIEIQALKPEIHADTLKAMAQGRGGQQRTVAAAYGRPQVVLAVADLDTAARRLNVVLSGIDAVGPLYLKRSYRVPDGDTGYAMELAAVISQGIIEGRWKSVKINAGAAARGMFISLQAHYAGFQEWQEMRRRLLELPGVADMHIDAESAQNAKLTLRYPGSPAELASALNAKGLALESGSDGLVLRSAY
jgi:hypothetical protein